jgi:hypothetical protein
MLILVFPGRRRNHRRMMQQTFNPSAAMRFWPVELKAVHGLLRRLLDDPGQLIAHVRQYVSLLYCWNAP